MRNQLLLTIAIGIILSIRSPIHAKCLHSSKEKQTLNAVETNTVISKNDGGSWQLDKAVLIENSENVTITVLPTVEKGWKRIFIKSKTTQTVKWRAHFSKN